MRIDIVSIFPDYLAPLRLSLPGKAIASGLVELGVHDLRQWTDDRHHSVDDTPYGGGAGMVMRPEPWGRALDALAGEDTVLLVMTPSGRRFDQALADELAAERHLLLACGRYEGFDARVATHARSRLRVVELSLGDYVLNGGEVAALAVVEAVVRLVPGVVGNPASLTEESHSVGHGQLLEYPSFTKPPLWRGLPVPEVLFSGHHARIAGWRHEQALELTRERRPDLLPDELVITEATPADAGELWTLQRAASVSDSASVSDAGPAPDAGLGSRHGETVQTSASSQTLEELRSTLADGVVLVARRAGRMLGWVRAEAGGEGWTVGSPLLAPDQQDSGVGTALLAAIGSRAPHAP